jgi:hypothetical protein
MLAGGGTIHRKEGRREMIWQTLTGLSRGGRILLAIVALAVLAAGCEQVVRPSRDVESRTYVVEAFDEIETGDGWRIDVRIGSPQSVVLESDDNVLDATTVEVSQGRLSVRLKMETLRPTELQATITVESLVEIEADGGARLDVEGLDATGLDLDLSGGARVTASGRVEELRLATSGGAGVDGSGLQVRLAEVDMSGGSNVDLNVSEAVGGSVSGASVLGVAGHPPAVDVETSGAGRLEVR